MLKRTLLMLGALAALGLGLTLAEASPPAKPAEATQGPRAKEGEACKSHEDCAQDKKPLACVKSKCTYDPKYVPPPT